MLSRQRLDAGSIPRRTNPFLQRRGSEKLASWPESHACFWKSWDLDLHIRSIPKHTRFFPHHKTGTDPSPVAPGPIRIPTASLPVAVEGAWAGRGFICLPSLYLRLPEIPPFHPDPWNDMKTACFCYNAQTFTRHSR